MPSGVVAAVAVVAAAAACRVLVLRGAAHEAVSRLPEVGRRVRGGPPAPFRRALADAAIEIDPEGAWTTWCLATLAGAVVGGVAGGPALAAIAVGVCAAAPAGVLLMLRDRSARTVDAALPEFLDAVGRSLRSGGSLAQALAETSAEGASGSARLREDVDAVVADIGRGAPLAAAVDRWAQRCPTRGVRLTAAALALAAESGGAAARAIDGVAETMRANLGVAAEIRAQSAQARISGLVIALSPLAFGALAAGTDRRTMAFFVRGPFGLVCLVAGLGLDGAAAWWMHRITEAPA